MSAWLHLPRTQKTVAHGDSGVVMLITSPSAAHSPGSAGCNPLAAGTMGVAVLAELGGSGLARRLVGGQSLRAGSVDSASHEPLLEVSLGVLRRASSR